MSCLRKQNGAVLIISLVLLLVMTLLGLTSMQSTSLEERMAGNERHANVAFQAAEAALRGAEDWLDGQNLQPTAKSDGSSGVWTLDSPEAVASLASSVDPWWKEWRLSDWSSNGIAYANTNSLVFAKDQSNADITLDNVPPRYVIEEVEVVKDNLLVGTQGDFSGRSFYQVTSRGTDKSGRMQILLRSTYARRF